ncbi:hypothetical protein CELD12_21720 [Cellulomonas sp. NTE-D12]|nr:hypothetical protein CELD12_21720 [Cellulomonas sp. NTE-D12]
MLNERKTYTYEAEHYRNSLTSFTEAEKRLFDGTAGDGIDLTLLTDRYSDDATVEESTTLGLVPIEGSVDEDEVVSDVPQAASDEISPERLSAAQRAFSLWASEDESEEVQSRQEAAITQSLLSRALPILGEGGDQQMLDWIEAILRFEPGVTPQVSLYLESLAGWGTNERRAVRSTLDGVVRSELLSDWQGIWIAYASGFLRGSNARRPHVEWLHERAQHGPDALAAHAAAALGRIGRGDPNVLAGTVDRLGSVWRTLALWGLAQVDRSRALEAADNQLDRILIESIGQ